MNRLNLREGVRCALILLAGLGVGAAVNAASDTPVSFVTPERADIKGLIRWQLFVEGTDASLEETYEAFQKGGVVFLDARSPYSYGRGHIPGALNLPGSRYSATAKQVLAGISEDREIITYCSGGSCQTSIQLANRLVEDGYRNVRAFYGGWGEWVKSDYPVREGASP